MLNATTAERLLPKGWLPPDGVPLRYRLEDFAFGLCQSCLGALPLETASALSGLLWRTLGPLVGNRRQARALANLARAYPELPAKARATLAAGMWENLGRTFAETFRLAEIAASDRLSVELPSDFDDEAAARVVCAAHQGNWEIAVLAVSTSTSAQPAGVYQRIKNPLVDARVKAIRSFLYPGGLYPKLPSTPRQLIRHAREGGTLAILADQRDMRGPRVDFFGQPTPSTPFPAMVARTLGLKLYAGEIIREPCVRFKVRLVEIPVPQTEDREADILAGTAALQSAFERSIRQRPEQWMWSHRRWG